MGFSAPLTGRLKSLLRIILISSLGGLIMLTLFQQKLIYHPRPYEGFFENLVHAQNISEISYITSEGRQIAFYVLPKSRSTPQFIWILFSGNAALALEWIDFVQNFPDEHTAFLLIDYPGYGKCEGKASPSTILDSTELAVEHLSKSLNWSPNQFFKKAGVLGHSLGAASALQFAVRHPISKIVLVSPFTSMKDMAALVVGRWLALFLTHRFDNRERLHELGQRSVLPQVSLFHGTQDEIIPVQMGQELAHQFPQMITYHEIPQETHNTILVGSEKKIFEVMIQH